MSIGFSASACWGISHDNHRHGSQEVRSRQSIQVKQPTNRMPRYCCGWQAESSGANDASYAPTHRILLGDATEIAEDSIVSRMTMYVAGRSWKTRLEYRAVMDER